MPTPQQALDYAKRFIGRMPVDDTEMKLRILNDSLNTIWHAAPWSWSVAALDIITLQDDQQDYDVTEVTDCNRLLLAYLDNGEQKWDLEIIGDLPETTLRKGQPSMVAFDDSSVLRVLPVPTGYGTEAPYLLSWYKKNPPVIITDLLNTEWYDLTGEPRGWFHVFQEFVLYRAMSFANYPKAGGVVVQEGKTQYSGQLGVAMAALQDMIDQNGREFLDTMGREVAA
jgi:hypothetical protein